MAVISWILDNFGGIALERILDKVFNDKPNDMKDAFDLAYSTWYVSHKYSIIQRNNYEKLKPRFIDYLCHKKGFEFDDEDEKSLFNEWLGQINQGTDAQDELQNQITQKLISEFSQFRANSVQLNEEVFEKLTKITESAIEIKDISGKVLSIESKITEIQNLISNTGLNTAIEPQNFSKVEGYIEHYVIEEKDKNNFVRYILKQKPQTLYDKVCAAKNSENKFLLVDKGQSGKTTELKELGYQLMQNGSYFPILFEADLNPNLSEKDLPKGDIYNNKNIVILIDAADEFTQEERSSFFIFIDAYAKRHRNIRIVISCRNNYEETKHLKEFKTLVFEDLTIEQWKTMIQNMAKDKANHLIDLIVENGLQEYMATPFEVSVITNYYLSTGKLLSTRADIYRQFIISKLEQDENKLRADSKHLRYDTLPYLERIAVVMQSYGNDFILDYPELLKCLNGNEHMLELIQRSNLIIPIGKDKYKFSENAYREYLAADYVSRQEFGTILSFVKYDNANSISQQWANVTMILISILFNKAKNKFEQLLKWLVDNEPEFILYLEKNTVDKNTRETIFRNLLFRYREQKRLIAPVNHQTSKKIIEFAESKETLEFLLSEVIKNKDTDPIYLENLYSFIEFADFYDLTFSDKQELVEAFTDVVFELIAKHVEDTDEKTFTLYFPLNNAYYHEDDAYTKRLVGTIGDSHNRFAVDSIISMVCFTKKYDEYADYVIDHEADIHDYQDKRGVTVSVLRFVVDKALENVTTKENIIKVLSHVCQRDFLLRNHYRDEDTLNIVKKLLTTAKSNNIFDGDVNSYRTLLEIYSKFSESSLFNKQEELFIEFRNLYKDCAFNDQLFNEAVANFRAQLKDGNFDQYMKAIGCVSLFLSKDNIDKLFESLDTSSADDYTLAVRISEIHDRNLEDYLMQKIDKKFGRHPIYPDLDSKKRKSIQQLLDYDKFRNAVIDAINKEPKNYKDLRHYTLPPKDNTDMYVCSFFALTSKAPYDLIKIRNCINDKECYYRFLLHISYQNREDKIFNSLLTEPIRKKLIQTAENNITLDRSYCFLSDVSLNLLIKGKLNLRYEQIEKLLPISDYSVGENNLFDYIVKIAEKEEKQEELLDYLCNHLSDVIKNTDVYTLWSCYIIRNDRRRLYPTIFDWMQNEEKHWLHVQILEAYWSVDAGKKFLRFRFPQLSENDKVSLLRIIESCKVKNKDDEEWIAGQLADYASYKDYNKKSVIQFLLYRGDLSALKFIVDNFELKYLEADYPYNYDQPEATDCILFLLHKYFEDTGAIIPDCYHSLKQSLINIASKDKDKRNFILEDLNSYAYNGNTWLYDEIEAIEETLLSTDDENKSFEEVLNAIPLLK